MATQPSKPRWADLQRGAARLPSMNVAARQQLLRGCMAGVERVTDEWVRAAWDAKHIQPGTAACAEDIMTGPLPTIRYLRLLDRTLEDISQYGQPRLPGNPVKARGRWRIPVFPTDQLYDPLLFRPIHAHVRMQEGVEAGTVFGDCIEQVSGRSQAPPCVTLVLGAGNVSSIPITDALTKIFQQNQAVLLKMNPVNAYVGPVFEEAFKPLIQADLLRIVYGEGDVGAELVASPDVDRIHITGSDQTHDAIVWGSSPDERAARKAGGTPQLHKPITSELGNVSPWIIVPGHYSRRQMRFQVENIAASITNNVSFNCVATKALITCRGWPQRQQFLEMLDDVLAKIPRRYAYYPGAAERFVRFSKSSANDPQHLPWTLRRDVDPAHDAYLFQEESFTCVCAEAQLDASSPIDFLYRAVEFANDSMWGTLSAAITAPKHFARQNHEGWEDAVDRLRYGTVGINQWPGVVFALMSTPWGAFPGATLQDIQSGMGSVHNTYLLDRPETTVIASPLTVYPKPVWFSTHRCPETVARLLVELYFQPRPRGLLPVLLHALRG